MVIAIDFEKATNTEPFAVIPFSGSTHGRGESLRNIFVREEGESDDGEDEEEEPVEEDGEEDEDGEEEESHKGPSPLP